MLVPSKRCRRGDALARIKRVVGNLSLGGDELIDGGLVWFGVFGGESDGSLGDRCGVPTCEEGTWRLGLRLIWVFFL